jgi:hypothetical protein
VFLPLDANSPERFPDSAPAAADIFDRRPPRIRASQRFT